MDSREAPGTLTSLQSLVGEPIAWSADITSPWATGTRTDLETLAGGEQVVVQRVGGDGAARAALGLRLRLGRMLPQIAPWLPLPEVLAGEATGPAPFVITRAIPGVLGSELLGDDANAALLGRRMGELAHDVGRVPTSRLRLPSTWGHGKRLAATARRWWAAAASQLGPEAAKHVGDLVERCADELGESPPVFAHGDYAPVNVLFRDRVVMAMLDLERARLAHPLSDAAWWRWIVRCYHPERWAAAGTAFVAGAGLFDNPRTVIQLNLLAALQCLEMLALSRTGQPAARRAWAARLMSVLVWERDGGL